MANNVYSKIILQDANIEANSKEITKIKNGDK